jgi:hypothetical protein
MLDTQTFDVVLLVADLRGFMPLSERLAPEQVVAILDRYLETMVEVMPRLWGLPWGIAQAILSISRPYHRNSCRLCSVYCLDDAQVWGIANLIYLWPGKGLGRG